MLQGGFVVMRIDFSWNPRNIVAFIFSSALVLSAGLDSMEVLAEQQSRITPQAPHLGATPNGDLSAHQFPLMPEQFLKETGHVVSQETMDQLVGPSRQIEGLGDAVSGIIESTLSEIASGRKSVAATFPGAEDPAWTDSIKKLGERVRERSGESIHERMATAYRLADYGHRASAAIPDLVYAAVETNHFKVAEAAIYAVKMIGASQSQVDQLLKGVVNILNGTYSSSPFMRQSAAMILGIFGSKAKAALPALIQVRGLDPVVIRKIEGTYIVPAVKPIITWKTRVSNLGRRGKSFFNSLWTTRAFTPIRWLINRFVGSGTQRMLVGLGPRGEFLGVAEKSGKLKLLSRKGKRIREFHLDSSLPRGLVLSHDGELLAGVDEYGIINIWDAVTGRLIRSLDEQSKTISALAFSPDGRYLYAGDEIGGMWQWDAMTGKEAGAFKAAESVNQRVSALAISPDGRFLVAGYDDGSVVIWEMQTGELKNKLGDEPWPITALFVNIQ